MSAAVKENGMPLATEATTFSVPRNTLRRRILSKTQIPKFRKHTTFPKETEKQLESYLTKLDNIGYGLTNKDYACSCESVRIYKWAETHFSH